MLGLPILDVAIGVSFFYLIFAFVCTTANETLAQWFKKRPRTLEEAITQLLGSARAKDLLSHPLILTLSRRKGNKVATPSYIPASTFTTALLDQLTGTQSVRDMAAVQAGIKTLPPDVAQSFTALLQKSGNDWDKFHTEVETLYKQTMDRASGWYKRYVQKQTTLLALVIVLWADFDTLHVAQRLWTDSALRAAVVEDAKARAQARSSGDVPLAVYNSDQPDKGTAVEPGGSPITPHEQSLINTVTGWEQDLNDLSSGVQQAQSAAGPAGAKQAAFRIRLEWILMHLLGWLLSILAIRLGTPFWFDVLNRFINLRGAGRAPDEPRAKNVSADQEVAA